MCFDVSICVICPRALRWVYNLQRPAGTYPCAVRINCSRAKCGCRICGIGRWKLQMGVGILFGCASQSGNSLPYLTHQPPHIYICICGIPFTKWKTSPRRVFLEISRKHKWLYCGLLLRILLRPHIEYWIITATWTMNTYENRQKLKFT